MVNFAKIEEEFKAKKKERDIYLSKYNEKSLQILEEQLDKNIIRAVEYISENKEINVPSRITCNLNELIVEDDSIDKFELLNNLVQLFNNDVADKYKSGGLIIKCIDYEVTRDYYTFNFIIEYTIPISERNEEEDEEW